MKVCTKCNVAKNEDNFFTKDKSTGRLHAQCKDCYREHRQGYAVEHYAKYGDKYRARAKERRTRIRRDLQVRIIDYLNDKSCIECGESDIRVLEFDHINPEDKKFGIAMAIRNGMKWEDVFEELRKCQILCANCHKKRTAVQFGWFKAIEIE